MADRPRARRRRIARRRPSATAAPRRAPTPIPSSIRLSGYCGWVSIARRRAARPRIGLVRAERLPLVLGHRQIEPGEHDHARAAAARSCAAAAPPPGAETAMPAATTKPAGGVVAPARAPRDRAAGCAARPDRCGRARASSSGQRVRIASSTPSDACQCAASIGSIAGSTTRLSRRGSTPSVMQLVERAGEIRRPAAPPRAASTGSPAARARLAAPAGRGSSAASSGSIAGGTASLVAERIEQPAEPLVELGIADRHHAAAAAARRSGAADEGIAQRARSRAIVGQQDHAARQRQRIARRARAISPAASASAKARCGGMVIDGAAAAAPQPPASIASVARDRRRRADVEPQPLMDDAERAPGGDRAIPQQVGRERPLGRIGEQPARDDLDAGEHERRDPRRPPPRRAARRRPCGNRRGRVWQLARASGTTSSSASIAASSQRSAEQADRVDRAVDPEIVAVDDEEASRRRSAAAPWSRRRRSPAAGRARRRRCTSRSPALCAQMRLDRIGEIMDVDDRPADPGRAQPIEHMIEQRLAGHLDQRLGPRRGERAHPLAEARRPSPSRCGPAARRRAGAARAAWRSGSCGILFPGGGARRGGHVGVEPCRDGRERRMGEIALQIAPHARLEAAVARACRRASTAG